MVKMRTGTYRVAALTLIGAVLSPALAALSTFSIPSDELSWKDAQQDPLSDALHLEVLDFERFDDGIVPIQPSLTIAVPAIPLDVVDEDLSQEDLDALFDFSQNVAQRDVVALERVVLEPESRTIEAGQVLIPRWGTFPRRAREVQILLGAGVTQISALMNVAESHPRPPVAEKFNKGLSLTPLGIFEQGLTIDRLEERLGWVFDGDPLTHFDRIDRVGQDVKQKWILFMDLGRYFPVRLIRFYPSPDVGVRVAAYTLSLGAPHTERTIAGLNLEDASVGRPGFPKFGSIGNTFPNWVIERRVPVNVADTVAMLFDPPSTMRYSRLDFDSDLDYDLGEIEFYADGFVPEATYVTRPLSLPRSTLGRISWEEETVGEPSRSRLIVRVQTGVNEEPEVLFRINDFETEVEWRSEGALVIDRRVRAATFGQRVDLNSPGLNLDAREIFSALSKDERAAVRLTRGEYQALSGNRRGKVEPDLEFWSGFQPARNGELIVAPSGNPFIQIQVEFSSQDPNAATAMRNLHFEFSAPQITDEVIGEIAPAAGVLAGRDTAFVLALRARLESENEGFNRVQVFTPARIAGIESVTMEIGEGQVQELSRISLDDAGRGAEPGQFKEVHLDDEQFVLGFPTIEPAADGTTREVLMRIRFRGRVIDFRTDFRVNVLLDTVASEQTRDYTPSGILILDVNGSQVDTLALLLPQPIIGQDVLDFQQLDRLADRNSLAVIADLSSQSRNLLNNFQLRPNPFTPNSDGINDEVKISYDIQRLLTPRPVRLDIYDLSGRRIRRLERSVASGGYSVTWDGRNEDGMTVAPGLYVVRLFADADDAGAAVLRLISVAY